MFNGIENWEKNSSQDATDEIGGKVFIVRAALNGSNASDQIL